MSRSEPARRPVRVAITSAQIEIAVSSGVRAPMSRPIGDITRPISVVGEPGLAQAHDPAFVGAARAHRADVADLGLHRGDDRGHVELVVVGEHAHDVALGEAGADLAEVRSGQVFTTSSAIGNRCTVANTARASHTVTRKPSSFATLRQRGGEVDRAEDDHAGRDDERLDEHRDRFFARLAVLAVVTGRAEPGLELAERVAADDPIEVGIAERADRVGAGPHQQLRADADAVDDRDERDRLRRVDRGAQRAVAASPSTTRSSTGSTKRWIVPPHVSPTENASSSE